MNKIRYIAACLYETNFDKYFDNLSLEDQRHYYYKAKHIYETHDSEYLQKHYGIRKDEDEIRQFLHLIRENQPQGEA